MAEFYLVKDQLGRFIPATFEDKEAANKVTVGDAFKGKIIKERNLRFHKKYFGMLKAFYDSQDHYTSFDKFRDEALIEIGHCKTHQSLDGHVSRIPKSISFDTVDNIKFEAIFNKTLHALLIIFIPELVREEFREKLSLMLLEFS